ncbi:unnamed protein product [Toxocara canis]|uniref:Ovule protein n=1 Tax=Toxocara canis TaxID=6265 RepID=A0A183UE45_TOXCA|nr:unnamed protein product [Toxocara canis]
MRVTNNDNAESISHSMPIRFGAIAALSKTPYPKTGRYVSSTWINMVQEMDEREVKAMSGRLVMPKCYVNTVPDIKLWSVLCCRELGNGVKALKSIILNM